MNILERLAAAESNEEGRGLAAALKGITTTVADVGGHISKRQQYWKRCARPGCRAHTRRRGFVTIGPSMETNMSDYYKFQRHKHMEPLEQYGHDTIGGAMTYGGTQFDQILSQPGGLAEFPAEQLIVLGWHRFRQVQEELTDAQRAGIEALKGHMRTCDYCADPVTGELLELPNEYAHKAHMAVEHKDLQGQKVLSDSMAGAIERIGEIVAKAMPQQSSPEATAQAMVMAISLYEQYKAEQAAAATAPVPGYEPGMQSITEVRRNTPKAGAKKKEEAHAAT